MTPRRVTRFGLAAVLVATVPLTFACSSNDTSSSTSTTTTTTSAKKSFEVQTEDGQVSISLDGQLPPNWPSSFPVPNGAKPAGSGSLGGSSTTAMVGVFSSTGSPEDAFNFYKSNSALTVTKSGSVGSGSTYVATVAFSGDPSGRATIVSPSGETLILVTLKTSGSTTGSTTGTTTGSSKAT